MPRQTLKRRADGRYVCKYHGICFYGKTQGEALEAREQYKREEKLGRPADKPTFREYAAVWLPTYKSGATANNYNALASYLERIADLLPDVPIDMLTPSDIKRMYNGFNHLGEGSRRRISTLTRAVCSSALADGLIRVNPCASVKHDRGKSGTHRALEQWEIDLIVSTAQTERCGLIAVAMLFAGLRRGEALAIDIDRDVDFTAGTISVRSNRKRDGTATVTGTPKTAAGTRTIPLFSPLRKALEGHHGSLMPKRDGTEGRLSGFESAWQTYNKHLTRLAGRDVFIRAHDCRHTFATMLYDADVDIKTAAKWMGHADVEMILRIYAHLTARKEQTAIDKVEDFFRTVK